MRVWRSKLLQNNGRTTYTEYITYIHRFQVRSCAIWPPVYACRVVWCCCSSNHQENYPSTIMSGGESCQCNQNQYKSIFKNLNWLQFIGGKKLNMQFPILIAVWFKPYRMLVYCAYFSSFIIFNSILLRCFNIWIKISYRKKTFFINNAQAHSISVCSVHDFRHEMPTVPSNKRRINFNLAHYKQDKKQDEFISNFMCLTHCGVNFSYAHVREMGSVRTFWFQGCI